jgi:hypothetical protein
MTPTWGGAPLRGVGLTAWPSRWVTGGPDLLRRSGNRRRWRRAALSCEFIGVEQTSELSVSRFQWCGCSKSRLGTRLSPALKLGEEALRSDVVMRGSKKTFSVVFVITFFGHFRPD